MAQPPRPGPPVFTVFLVVATAGLSTIVLWQRRVIDRLEGEVRRVSAVVGSTALPPGELLAPLETFTPAGEPATLDFAAQPRGTVLVVLSAGCGACDEVQPRLAAMARLSGPMGPRFVAVQSDAKSPAELRPTPHVGPDGAVALVGVARGEATWLRRVVLVPGVLMVGPDARLRGAWYGAPTAAQWSEIQATLAATGAPSPPR